ncbi:MAG: acyl carrier protein [Candidatus Hydrothermarchaeota archaeon]|nr:MAG: acyl carrier protein [Candidatus Hydrothermarchaeota archaeon]
MKDSIEKKVREFIRENFLMGEDDGSIGPDDSLLDNGIIDSTGILELVAFLEETFEIEVKDEELVPENLDTISFIVSYIERKLAEEVKAHAAQ